MYNFWYYFAKESIHLYLVWKQSISEHAKKMLTSLTSAITDHPLVQQALHEDQWKIDDEDKCILKNTKFIGKFKDECCGEIKEYSLHTLCISRWKNKSKHKSVSQATNTYFSTLERSL